MIPMENMKHEQNEKDPETFTELKSSTDIFWGKRVHQVEALVLFRVDVAFVFLIKYTVSHFCLILSTLLLLAAD